MDQDETSELVRLHQVELEQAEFRGYLRGMKFISQTLMDGTQDMKMIGMLIQVRIAQEERDFFERG